MTEALADDGHWDTGGQHQRRRTMPEVMDADRPETSLTDECHETFSDTLRRDRRAVLAGEHETMVAVRVAPCRALCVLVEPVTEENTDDAAVEFDDAVFTARGLRPAEHGAAVLLAAVRARCLLAVERDDLLADDQHSTLQVDI